MYYSGLGIKKDIQEAVRLFTEASEAGDTDAQEALGKIYASGDGVAQDYNKAFIYYSEAAMNGSAIGKRERDAAASHLTSTQIHMALKKLGIE